MRDLAITLVQQELQWEDPAQNRAFFEKKIREQAPASDLIVLPEMFTTGFSMNALGNAEPVNGPTQTWMQALAIELNCAITGSIAVGEGDAVYNRLLFVTPDSCSRYDKRHLFRMLGEHKRYAAGQDRVIVTWRDWRIKLEVCYDLRFPVFSRNKQDYDLLLYVANWPSARAHHWRTLLQARAIENLAYVVGVNRIGADANGLTYSGDSLLVDPRGQLVVDMQNRAGCEQGIANGSDLRAYHEQFPAFMDSDSFDLTL
ncbi:MAG: amidohydrolase [Halieaceae bacterium]|nr:amidohydrolase [Halieaceae bacterium]